MVETGPTTGQIPSSRALFVGELIDSLRAGQASAPRLVSAEIPGCLWRA
jgi:hypothetical protein